MTQAQTLPRPRHDTPSADAPRKGGIVSVMLIISLLCTIAMQTLGRSYHDKLMPRRSTSHLSGLDSFTLGLLLGGLRGPLVMILWTNSENQKSEKNLENVETQIELIRMLQPEFMSVHIFQMWNKAYNLSVQMASLPNRYSTILDAIDYGKKVDQEYHNDINIMDSIAQIYYNKFGTGADRHYYIERVRKETKFQPAIPTPRSADASYRPTIHPQMLDADGNILPEYKNELKYLVPYDQFGGFKDGISPLALAYNYHKRAQVIMATTSQRHLQLSDSVIDSRPAIDLRTWAEEEWGRGRAKVLITFGLRTPQELHNMDRITMVGLPSVIDLKSPAPDKSKAAREQIDLALFAYDRCARVCKDAEKEYNRHLENGFASNAEVYQSHIATVQALGLEARADHDYLALAADQTGLLPLSQTLPGATPDALRKQIAQEYQYALDAYYRLLLRNYVPGELADQLYPKFTQKELGVSYSRGQIPLAPPKVYPSLLAEVTRIMKEKDKETGIYRNYYSDAEEFLSYIRGAQARLDQMKRR
jgi:hypothetical protein